MVGCFMQKSFVIQVNVAYISNKPVGGWACFSTDRVCRLVGSCYILWQRWDNINCQTGVTFVSYKQKYVHKVLVNRLVKLAKEKSVVRRTDRTNMTIAVDWDIEHQTKQIGNTDLVKAIKNRPINLLKGIELMLYKCMCCLKIAKSFRLCWCDLDVVKVFDFFSEKFLQKHPFF